MSARPVPEPKLEASSDALNCNHRKYIPHLLDLVASAVADPLAVLSHIGRLSSAIEAYQQFDRRAEGWIKVQLVPGA